MNPNTDQESRKYRMRWWTLGVLSISLVIVVIDNTIVNVALPTLQRDLAASASALQWIVDSYILVFAGLLLTMGSLGDRFGRKRALQIGLLIFAFSSVGAAFAESSGQLITARIVMGIGGALIMPSTLSVLVDVFPREERARAIGIWASAAGLGIPLGPVVGGWLLVHFWWGSVFFINIPLILAALIGGWFLVPESRDPASPRTDFVGMALTTGALAMLVYAIIEGPALGWSDPAVLGAFAGALVLGTAFVAYELRTDHPMLNMRLFRNPRFSSGSVTLIVASLALAGVTFTLIQYFQVVREYTPLEAGVRMVPLALGFALGARGGSQLVAGLGTKKMAAGGLLVIAASLIGFSFLGLDTAYWMVGILLAIMGVGLGSSIAPSTDAVMGAVPEANAGVGSAVNDTARQVGYALGVGVVASVLNTLYTSKIQDALAGLPADAYDLALNSVGGAARVAASMGGASGDSLRIASNTAFVDAFGVAMLVGASIALIWGLLVVRFMPAQDLPVSD